MHTAPRRVHLHDHLNGFDNNLHCVVLDHLQHLARDIIEVRWTYFATPELQKKYPCLKFVFDHSHLAETWQSWFANVPACDRTHERFMCCFNHGGHVGRKLLVSALRGLGLYDPEVMSQHFDLAQGEIDGHIRHLLGDRDAVYSKFFDLGTVSSHPRRGFQPVELFDHDRNILSLLLPLGRSWLNLVSETFATSYYPWITEKFLYSVSTSGLWITYGQPLWHYHVHEYFGFQLHNDVFDYDFDQQPCPVRRLIQLLDTVTKYQRLSWQDRHDVWVTQHDVVSRNRDHLLSGDWLRHVRARVEKDAR